MKKLMKQIIFVFAMVMAIVSFGSNAQAKTTKLTMVVGEEFSYYYIGIGTLNSVKSTNPKVVYAKKKNSNCYMKAKKAGTATVTSKGARGTFVHNITVKKADFKFKATRYKDNYAKISVKNNTSVYFDSLIVTVILRDKSGKKLKEVPTYLHNICPKQTAIDSVYLGMDYAKVDMSKTTYKIQMRRDPDYSYKNYAKKVSFSEKKRGEGYSTYIDVTSKTSYSGKGSVKIAYDVSFYDAQGKLIYISTYSATLFNSQKKKTTSIAMYNSAASYKINKRVILSEYKKK